MSGTEYTVMGAQLECSCGATPSVLLIPIPKGVLLNYKPIATKMDFIPFVNILPFGMCTTKYPPIPCIPAIVGPWMKTKSSYKVMEFPVVTTDSCLTCGLGGRITVTSSGQ